MEGERRNRAENAIGKTVRWAGNERAVPALSEKLRVPRPGPDPEDFALGLLVRHFQAYMRVVRLIEDIGKIPGNSTVNVARGSAYDAAKGALLLKFAEDYTDMQRDFETAITTLEVVRDSSSEGQGKDIF